ncbi:MAG: hypothetical protein JNL54_07975 [Kineosporiaceae bacterium]|nr:hypothetical protein [Kineosporiaceae bacterium]
MRRDQLEHAIRTACQIIGRPEVVVVGSQSILGTYREDELPADATMSVEVDILPMAADNEETARLADLIEGVAGEFSPFEELHGFSIDGVDLETPRCRPGGGIAWSRFRTPTRLPRQGIRSSPDGAWTRKTSASPSSARCGRRTATSSSRCCMPDWSTRRSSRLDSPPLRIGTERPRTGRRAG